MEYPFITLDDGTQISHSEMLADRSVLVYGWFASAKHGLPVELWVTADSETL